MLGADPPLENCQESITTSPDATKNTFFVPVTPLKLSVTVLKLLLLPVAGIVTYPIGVPDALPAQILITAPFGDAALNVQEVAALEPNATPETPVQC